MSKVLVLGKIHQAGIDLLRRDSSLAVTALPDHSPRLIEEVSDADAIIVRMTPVGEGVIAAAPRLRVVARHGVGYDTIDVAALTRRGIPLAVVGDVNSGAVAEHALALMLAMAKRIVIQDQAVRDGRFDIRDGFAATELAEKVLLVVGFGRIGREVARLCSCFGMRVLVADPYVDASTISAAGYEYVADFRARLSDADYLSIHVPKSNDTSHLIGSGEIAAMKAGACLVNVSRGGIVDEAALTEALESGHLRAAALDVFDPEPPKPDNPLFRLDSVVLSPHSGAFTQECGRRMAVVCARNVLAALTGTLNADLVVNRVGLRQISGER